MEYSSETRGRDLDGPGVELLETLLPLRIANHQHSMVKILRATQPTATCHKNGIASMRPALEKNGWARDGVSPVGGIEDSLLVELERRGVESNREGSCTTRLGAGLGSGEVPSWVSCAAISFSSSGI